MVAEEGDKGEEAEPGLRRRVVAEERPQVLEVGEEGELALFVGEETHAEQVAANLATSHLARECDFELRLKAAREGATALRRAGEADLRIWYAVAGCESFTCAALMPILSCVPLGTKCVLI